MYDGINSVSNLIIIHSIIYLYFCGIKCNGFSYLQKKKKKCNGFSVQFGEEL